MKTPVVEEGAVLIVEVVALHVVHRVQEGGVVGRRNFVAVDQVFIEINPVLGNFIGPAPVGPHEEITRRHRDHAFSLGR